MQQLCPPLIPTHYALTPIVSPPHYPLTCVSASDCVSSFSSETEARLGSSTGVPSGFRGTCNHGQQGRSQLQQKGSDKTRSTQSWVQPPSPLSPPFPAYPLSPHYPLHPLFPLRPLRTPCPLNTLCTRSAPSTTSIPSYRLDVLDKCGGGQHVQLVVHEQAVWARRQRQHHALVEATRHILAGSMVGAVHPLGSIPIAFHHLNRQFRPLEPSTSFT